MTDRERQQERDTGWLIAAIVLIGVGVLVAIAVSAVNYDRLEHQSRQRAHDRDVQIAQAKTEAARQVAVAKAEVQRQLCGIIGVLQPFPVSRQLAAKEGCTPEGQPIPSPTSTVPAPHRTGTAAGPAPTVRPSAGSGPALPTAAPTTRPTPTPTPSMRPTSPALLCVLTICLGGS